jgi:uncharacterized protein HemY
VPKLLRCLGGIAITRDQDFAHAGTLYANGLDKARTMNNQEDIIYLLNNLAVVAHQQGRYSEATALLNEGLGLARSLIHKVAIGFLIGNLGRIAAHERHWNLAHQCFEEGLIIATAVNHHEMITSLHLCQGLLAVRQQKFQQAEDHLQNAINHAHQNGYRYGAYQTIAAWGWLDKQQQAAHKPSRYLQIFQELAQSYQFSRPPDEYGTPPDIAYLERPKIIYD